MSSGACFDVFRVAKTMMDAMHNAILTMHTIVDVKVIMRSFFVLPASSIATAVSFLKKILVPLSKGLASVVVSGHGDISGVIMDAAMILAMVVATAASVFEEVVLAGAKGATLAVLVAVAMETVEMAPAAVLVAVVVAFVDLASVLVPVMAAAVTIPELVVMMLELAVAIEVVVVMRATVV